MKYNVAAVGSNGKSEKYEIEADSISVLKGNEESLVLFKKRGKVVLMIPQSLLLSACQNPPKDATVKVIAERPLFRIKASG